ncbi:hypothetical protein ALC60_00239 [Trachymyrmex zeteki]|uniref:Uncharacterized protein n=1 Tax=Mycetomoellerius zeteki TaxID=64791 RepID=A0A151XJN1_9HYME|nr:hypothetical protein ALC60_00239 [Trachymyrmex zeteki]
MHILQTHTHLAPRIEANMVTQLAKYDNEYFLGKYPKGGDGSGGGSDDSGGVVAWLKQQSKYKDEARDYGRHGREKGSIRLPACATICKNGWWLGYHTNPLDIPQQSQRDTRDDSQKRQAKDHRRGRTSLAWSFHVGVSLVGGTNVARPTSLL